MGLFRGAAFHQDGVPEILPISANGAFPLLNGPFSDLNGPFARMPYWAVFKTLLKIPGKQSIKKRGALRGS